MTEHCDTPGGCEEFRNLEGQVADMLTGYNALNATIKERITQEEKLQTQRERLMEQTTTSVRTLVSGETAAVSALFQAHVADQKATEGELKASITRVHERIDTVQGETDRKIDKVFDRVNQIPAEVKALSDAIYQTPAARMDKMESSLDSKMDKPRGGATFNITIILRWAGIAAAGVAAAYGASKFITLQFARFF